jgi:hypothetical protein
MAEEWAIFDYVDLREINTISIWLNNLQKPERARMDRKIEALRDNGPNLSSELLSDTKSRNIKKIRLNGRVAPRLLLCRGPIEMDRESTLLFGAVERDRKFVPKNAVELAEENRDQVIANPTTRRVPHGFAPATADRPER